MNQIPRQQYHPSLAPKPLAARHRASIDGVMMPSTQTRRQVRRSVVAQRPTLRQATRHQPAPPTFSRPPARAVPPALSDAQTAPPRKRSRIPSILKDLGVIVVALIAGLFIQSVVFGQLLLLAYAVGVFVLRIASRTTFLLALLSLGVVLIASARTNSSLAGVFAVYAFLLLAIGTISLGREVRDEL